MCLAVMNWHLLHTHIHTHTDTHTYTHTHHFTYLVQNPLWIYENWQSCFFFLNWIFYLYTFKMLSPLSVSPLNPPIPSSTPVSMRVLLYPPTHSHLTALAFPYTVALGLQRNNALPSHWCPTRPSSATYAAGAMGPSMHTLWLVL
jgi:hypothetical protein